VIAHPDFPSGSSATPKASGSVDINTPDIVYTKDDDAAIDKFHRETGESMLFYSVTNVLMQAGPIVETSWHSVTLSFIHDLRGKTG